MIRQSIGFRLASWYFLVLACGLALFSVVAWFAMRASVYKAMDDELTDRVGGVVKFMSFQISALSLPEIQDEFREHSVLGPGGDLFQVCNQSGEWLYRSVPLEANNVPITLPEALPQPRFENLRIQGHLLRFFSSRVVVDGKPYTVQVAVPMDEVFEALDRFRLLLLLAAPGLLIAASAGGYWLSTRALAPVDAISLAAQRIGIANLSERLPVTESGDQLQRLSETLNATFARLEDAVRRIRQFTADASHELRAPISLIRTTAEVAVQKSDRSAEEYFKALQEILEESERTSEVVDSLMLLARADSGKEAMELVAADARVIVREAAEQGEKLARSHGLGFSVLLPDTPIPVFADSHALRRALLILIDNAVKYTPKEGSVRLGLEENSGSPTVFVSDTGIGIAQSEIPHIFDRFWRADKARSREQGGAGLGLSIAKWIVEMHHGSIQVESQPGRGSTFRVRLPALTPESSMSMSRMGRTLA